MESVSTNKIKMIEKNVLVVASLLIAFSLYYLLVDDTFFGLLGSKNEDTSRPIVGKVLSYERDTRLKEKNSFSWGRMRETQKIRLGDSVFTGASSRSTLELQDGGNLEMGENTLIVFEDVKGIKIPQLKMGSFKLNISGNVRVGVGNEIAEVSGNNTMVEFIVKNKSKPIIKVFKGRAQVKSKTASLMQEKGAQVVAVESSSQSMIPRSPSSVDEIKEIVLEPQSVNQSFLYIDRLYDFYEKMGDRLAIRRHRRNVVELPVKLLWKSSSPTDRVEGQISETPNFDRSVQFFQTREQGQFTISPVFIGTNYWRISVESQKWTRADYFQVENKPLEWGVPQLVIKDHYLPILESLAVLKFMIQADDRLRAFVVEISNSSDFLPEKTEVRWVTQKNQNFSFDKAGTYFLRARGLNERTEITNYSMIESIEVMELPRLKAPMLTRQQFNVYKEDLLDMMWVGDQQVTAYEVQLRDSNGRVVKTEKVDIANWQWKPPVSGDYTAQIFSIDKYGRKSDFASTVAVKVVDRPLVVEAPKELVAEKVVEKDFIKQEMPNENKTVARIEDPTLQYLNRTFDHSRVELMGAGFTMYSSEQVSQNQPQPFALTLGVKWQGWTGNHGLEGNIRSKVMGLNEDANQASPLQVEAKYSYKIPINWNLFSGYQRTNLAGVIGYEMYRNQSSSLFSTKYDLTKIGFSILFPVASRWDAGGEFLYGTSADASTKYEISGYLDYFFSKKFSAGFGYRVHLFEAGSLKSTPSDLPYREGFSEGYSTLRWHY